MNYEENSVEANEAIYNKIVDDQLDANEAAAVLQAQYSGFYQIAGKSEKRVLILWAYPVRNFFQMTNGQN